MRKWQKYLLTCLIAASSICVVTAEAAPQNGMGAYVGLIGASEGGVGSGGLSLGMDAQFVIDDKWSLNPYLMLSAEKNSNSYNVSDTLVGLPVRRWFDEWFVGVHVFEHDRLLIDSGRVTSSAYGLGTGLLAGVEYASGWGAEVQADMFEFIGAGVFRNAVRLHLTYRWH